MWLTRNGEQKGAYSLIPFNGSSVNFDYFRIPSIRWAASEKLHKYDKQINFAFTYELYEKKSIGQVLCMENHCNPHWGNDHMVIDR